MKLLLLADVIYALVSLLKRPIRVGFICTGSRPWWNQRQTCSVLLIQVKSQFLSFWICLQHLIQYAIVFSWNTLEKLQRGLTWYSLEVVSPTVYQAALSFIPLVQGVLPGISIKASYIQYTVYGFDYPLLLFFSPEDSIPCPLPSLHFPSVLSCFYEIKSTNSKLSNNRTDVLLLGTSTALKMSLVSTLIYQ